MHKSKFLRPYDLKSPRCPKKSESKLPLASYLLVSDDDNLIIDELAHPNRGYTLPGNSKATHNTALSPLFWNRSGRVNESDYEYVTMWSGLGSYYWSKTARNANQAYRAWFNAADLDPSNTNWHSHIFPLRCLVSTNNR